MSEDFYSGPNAKYALELIGDRRYDEIAQFFEDQLAEGADFSSTIRAYAFVLLIADQFDRLLRIIESRKAHFLEDPSSVRLCAAILSVLDRQEDAQEFAERFGQMGGTHGDLLTESAVVAGVSGRPDLQLKCLQERAFLPEVDRNKALFKYLQVCLQYNEIDRAQAIRTLVDFDARHGEHIIATLDAANHDRCAVLDRVSNWLSSQNASPRLFGIIENLWIQAGIPELFDPMRQAALRWRHEPRVTGTALLYHFVGMKGVNPGNLPIVSELDIRSNNHLSVIEALIEHGDLNTAENLLQKTVSLTSSKNQDRRDLLRKLITSLKSLSIRRKIIVDNPEQDWLLSDPADPGKLCIVFTGLNGRTGIGGLQILDRYLAACGYQVLYVRDFNRLAYAKGIVSRGSNQTETLDAFSQIIQSTGVTDPIFFGASIGTVGAIEYGLKLKVRRILAFGYHSRIKNKNRWRIGDARAPLVNFRERRWASETKSPLSVQLERADHSFQIDMFFERSNLVDAFYARSLRDQNGIQLHPMSSSMSHNCLRSMMIDGSLERFLLSI